MNADSIKVREARMVDAVELARLAAELGYPMPSDEMARRLVGLLDNERHHVSVAQSEPDQLVGWVHVEHRSTLEGGERAELMGLVVDSATRRGGVGKVLLAEAERWACLRGLDSLAVRSNVVRDASHAFYLAVGFSRLKTQHVYTKRLDPK